jgi:CubicO group peptidase (beta-lactamase class C family)
MDLAHVAGLVVETHGAAPCAVVAASMAGKSGTGVCGTLTRDADAPLATAETHFDLASVSKPFLAVTMARLVRQGHIAWGEPLSKSLPELAETDAGSCPLGLLLAHRSGLAAHRQLYLPLIEGRSIDRAKAIRDACENRPECSGPRPPEGCAPVYSDMGYLLLGLAIEARMGGPLDQVVTAEVTRPLGIEDRVGSARQQRARHADFLQAVAPTEEIAFRGGVVHGVVHDENSWAINGEGLSGHAGLFGDAASVRTFGEALLSALERDDGWLGPADLAPLVRERQGGTLRAGFDGRGESPSSGSRLGPRTFGHLGFTGTSLWLDPDAGFCGVLLTNRVHKTRDHIAIRAARPLAYDAMFDALKQDR